jgi:hypothetical protein
MSHSKIRYVGNVISDKVIRPSGSRRRQAIADLATKRRRAKYRWVGRRSGRFLAINPFDRAAEIAIPILRNRLQGQFMPTRLAKQDLTGYGIDCVAEGIDPDIKASTDPRSERSALAWRYDRHRNGAAMPDFFDEQEYARKFVQAGLNADAAATLAAHYAQVYLGGGPATGGDEALRPLVALLDPAPSVVAPELPSSPLPRTDRLPAKPTKPQPADRLTSLNSVADKVVVLAEKMRRTTMPTRKRETSVTATADLVDKVNQAKQTALLKQTRQQIKEQQLSLFDLAPWPDSMRAIPNDLARTALFTTRNKRVPRAALQNTVIFHVNKDVSVTYTGVELRAEDDELVWQQVLEYAKRTALGEPVSFTFYELCRDLDWSINTFYYRKAAECLSRLQATSLAFVSNRIGRIEAVSLVHRFRVLNAGTKISRCQVEIDEEIVVLFAGQHYTTFVWEKYRKLSPTARRLFDYFASHREPYPMKLETFRLMCGSESARLNKWREQVSEACDQLHKSGLVESAWVDHDLVHCKR